MGDNDENQNLNPEPAAQSPVDITVDSPTDATTTPAEGATNTPPTNIPAENATTTPAGEIPQPVVTQAATDARPSKFLFNISRYKELLQKIYQKRAQEKQANQQKVLAMAKQKGRITKEDVEKLLNCRHSAAGEYLTILVRQGQLKASGGFHHKDTFYTPSN